MILTQQKWLTIHGIDISLILDCRIQWYGIPNCINLPDICHSMEIHNYYDKSKMILPPIQTHTLFFSVKRSGLRIYRKICWHLFRSFFLSNSLTYKENKMGHLLGNFSFISCICFISLSFVFLHNKNFSNSRHHRQQIMHVYAWLPIKILDWDKLMKIINKVEQWDWELMCMNIRYFGEIEEDNLHVVERCTSGLNERLFSIFLSACILNLIILNKIRSRSAS